MRKVQGLSVGALLAFIASCAAPAGAGSGAAAAPQAGPHNYWVYVANESSDLISRVRFDGENAVEYGAE